MVLRSQPVATPTVTKLYLDENDFYVHSATGTLRTTDFSRYIDLSTVGAVSSTSPLWVICRVYWQDRSRSFNYDLETLLYNWR